MLDDHFNVERLVRAMILGFWAIADSSFWAVSHHLPTVSAFRHFGRSPLRVRVNSTSWFWMGRRRPEPP